MLNANAGCPDVDVTRETGIVMHNIIVIGLRSFMRNNSKNVTIHSQADSQATHLLNYGTGVSNEHHELHINFQRDVAGGSKSLLAPPSGLLPAALALCQQC